MLTFSDGVVTLSRKPMNHIACIAFAFFISSALAAPPTQNADQNTSVDTSTASSSTTGSSTVDVDTTERATSLKLLVPNILRDQKPIWTFPLKLAQGKHWKPFLGVAIGTAALV